MALLEELKNRGVKTAVLSNKADFAVKKLSEEYFGGLLMAAVGENEAAFAVMRELGASAESTLYVGDSEVDIQTAGNAGVDCLCVTWGFRDREFLKENGAELFIDAPLELLEYCRG